MYLYVCLLASYYTRYSTTGSYTRTQTQIHTCTHHSRHYKNIAYVTGLTGLCGGAATTCACHVSALKAPKRCMPLLESRHMYNRTTGQAKCEPSTACPSIISISILSRATRATTLFDLRRSYPQTKHNDTANKSFFHNLHKALSAPRGAACTNHCITQGTT
jgi:hypothetical protein